MTPFNNLAFKLFLSHFAAALIVAMGLGVYSVHQTQQAYLTSLQRALEDQARILADAIAPALADGARDRIEPVVALFDDRISASALVIESSGVLVGATEREYAPHVGSLVSAEGVDRALAGETYGAILPGSVDLVYVVMPVSYQGRLVGAVRVSYTLEGLQDQIGPLITALGFGLAGAVLISVVLSWFLAFRLSSPARKLAAAARALAEGDLSRRSEVTGSDEMAKAAQAFDEMAERLHQGQEQRESLLRTVSHEIHSTITGMSMAHEVLAQNGGRSAGPQKMLIDGLGTHIQRLSRLADDLLEAARLSRGTMNLHLSEVAPAGLVASAVAAFAADAMMRGVRLGYRADAAIPAIEVDPDRLGQCLGNLIENGLRHSPAGTQVLVSAELDGPFCVFSVADEGPGTATEEPVLYGRGKTGPGGRLGLGLSIVRGLVEAHGGHFSLESRSEGGTVGRIRLPLQREPRAAAALTQV